MRLQESRTEKLWPMGPMTALMLLGPSKDNKQKTHTNPSVWTACSVWSNQGRARFGRSYSCTRKAWCDMVWGCAGSVGESGLNMPINLHCLAVMPHAELPVGSSTGHWTCLCFASPGRLLSCCGCSPDGWQLPSTLRGPAETYSPVDLTWPWFQ